MLREVQNARQIAGELPRRWFTSDWFDLIVWLDQDNIAGFQLCYDKHGNERALTWKGSGEWRHLGVDDGENRDMHHKASPILVADGVMNTEMVLGRFIRESDLLPADIAGFVVEQLGCIK